MTIRAKLDSKHRKESINPDMRREIKTTRSTAVNNNSSECGRINNIKYDTRAPFFLSIMAYGIGDNSCRIII